MSAYEGDQWDRMRRDDENEETNYPCKDCGEWFSKEEHIPVRRNADFCPQCVEIRMANGEKGFGGE